MPRKRRFRTPPRRPTCDRLGDQIAELSARIQVATYELLCYLREFDRHHGWEGFRSCAHWLNWRTGLDLGAAREKLRVAAALADLNHISAAMACGRLSYSVVRALTRVATPATEARLVAVACCATAAQVERLVRAWRQADRAAQPDAEQLRLASRALSTRVDEAGMVVLRARLTPEVGAVLLRALEAALEQVPAAAQEDQAPTLAQRRADALGLVAESALAGALDAGSPGDRYQVAVHVAAETLAASPEPAPAALGAISAETRELSPAASAPAAPAVDLDAGQAVIEQAGGIHVGKEVARRIACDAGLVVLRHAADGNVLDVGRRTRTIPTALRRALEDRDRNQCQFPGCSSRHCDAHHVVHWADGGATRLTNLVLCCRFHHRAVHEEGFQVVPGADGQFRFLRPDGKPLPTVPPAVRWEGAPLAPTDARLAAAGISIGPHTRHPRVVWRIAAPDRRRSTCCGNRRLPWRAAHPDRTGSALQRSQLTVFGNPGRTNLVAATLAGLPMTRNLRLAANNRQARRAPLLRATEALGDALARGGWPSDHRVTLRGWAQSGRCLRPFNAAT